MIFRGVIECVQKSQFLYNFARTDQAERAKVNIKFEGEEAAAKEEQEKREYARALTAKEK